MTRSTLKAVAIASCLGLFTAACGGDSGAGPSAPPVQPAIGTVWLHNASNTNIVEVNFSGCTDSDWGPNRLDDGEVIAPDGVRSWAVPAGCYDFRAQTASKAGSWYDLMLSAGGTLNLQLSSAANEVPSFSTLKSR